MNRKLGYYTVDGIEFFSKIQSCLHASKLNQTPNWHFNNDIFNSYNWTIEPNESLDELYNARARQLREEYDYVALSYSGGSDSHNILMSFLRQGLHIDELIINTMEKGTKNVVSVSVDNKTPESGLWSEHLFQTMPMIRDISTRYPQIKISIYDMTDHLIEMFTNATDGNWVENRREVLNPCGTTRYNVLAEADIKRRLDAGKKSCIMLGVDKPKTYIDITTNDFYIIFNDRATNHGPTQHTGEYDNCIIELFYWSPFSTRMLSKQCHILKRWIENNPQLQHRWYLKNLTPENWFNFQEPLLKSLIYTTWNQQWYQADKPTSDWHCEYDNWFFKNHNNSLAYYNWKKGIEYIKKNASDHLNINKNGVVDSLKPHAHFYRIGKINVQHIT
jgi:hypothetical protein